MILGGGERNLALAGAPRIRGDDPTPERGAGYGFQCSPHPRG